MDTEEKIENYHEIKELRYHFRKELLSELFVFLEKLKYEPDEENGNVSQSDMSQQKIGFDDCKSSVKYKLEELVKNS